MNKTAEQLKKRLEEIFDAVTERSSLLAETTMDVPIDDKTQKAFDFLEKETLEIITTNLKNGDTFCWPDDDYFLHLRTLLSFKPYFIYPSWHARDDITEDELLALENEIIAEDLPKLEPLRSPTRRQDFEMPMLNTYWKFKTHLSNTRYMIVVLVHIAKHFNAPSAAKSLLRVASLLHWERLTDVPNFRPQDIDEICDLLSSAINESKIAMDYEQLEDWDTFSKREHDKLIKTLQHGKQVEDRQKGKKKGQPDEHQAN